MNTVWDKLNNEEKQQLNEFNESYRQILSAAKTEREFVVEAVKLAEAAGYRSLAEIREPLKTGDKVYAVNRGKNLCMFMIGEEPLTSGMNILGAHIDSPRLDLKQCLCGLSGAFGKA